MSDPTAQLPVLQLKCGRAPGSLNPVPESGKGSDMWSVCELQRHAVGDHVVLCGAERQ